MALSHTRRHNTRPINPQTQRWALRETTGAYTAADVGVHEVDAGGLHSDDHLAGPRLGNRPFLDVQHGRRPVLRRCDDSHAHSFGSLGQPTVDRAVITLTQLPA